MATQPTTIHRETSVPLAQAHETQAGTQETASEEGVLASLGLNAQLFVFQFINFVIVAAIIWFLILRPLTKKMEERRRQINDSLDKAKEIETNLQMSQIKYQERIDEAKVEANKIMEKVGADAETQGQRLREKAKQEIQFLIDQAKKNIQKERDEMVSEVKGEMASLITLALEKILREKVDEAKDKKIIEEAIKDIERT